MFKTKDNRKMDLIIRLLLRQEVRQIYTLLKLRKIGRFMATLNEWLDTVLVKVTDTNGKADSLIVLFKELEAKITAGLSLTPAQEAKLGEIVDATVAQSAEIDAALSATPPT